MAASTKNNMIIFGATGLIGSHITNAILKSKDKFNKIEIFTSPNTIWTKSDDALAGLLRHKRRACDFSCRLCTAWACVSVKVVSEGYPKPHVLAVIVQQDRTSSATIVALVMYFKRRRLVDKISSGMPLTIAGKPVGAIGYGCIPLTNYFTPIPKEQGFAVLKEALKHGANFWNGGWIYGTPDWNSLHFFREYFEKFPDDVDKVVISIKGCFDMRSGTANADRESVRQAIEKCLELADGKFKIDVFQAARLDPNVPVEETVGAAAEYVKAGKIGGIGLMEVSLFETSIFTDGVAEACKEFDIPIVAYSPLGRGFLTGQMRRLDDLPEKDVRRMLPRFQPENLDVNLKLVEDVEQIAKKKACTPGQIATTWVIQQTALMGATAIPTPGTGNPARIEENVKVVELTRNELKEINNVLSKAEVKGDRYPAQFEKWLKV
ncbi:hypothetical protein AC579_8374 [Pseudocercospora musae]|uniref:NADP-dependent oxidoreductase domain-containing protein n=1 Tax=Pseudocercospora musae TaxID=113226 RepID=A0A139IIP0_9PEZI|nr:hypothetical protein AC579_8374 [Pseudocercospora musae]